MRIRSCHIERFGAFVDRSIRDLDHPFVVLLGPNEAGKTTLFRFIITMMYGFRPATSSKHPYVSNDGYLAGSMELTAGRTLSTVARRLKSTPKGTHSTGQDGLFGRTETLRNRPLSVVASISQEVFEAVYALTLGDMAQVEETAWQTIEDRLLGGLNVEHIRSTRPVIDELTREANKMWRPDRRGKTIVAAEEERLRSLRAAAREARERDALIRRHTLELQELERETARLEIEVAAAKADVRRTRRLQPVRSGVERIDELAAAAGDTTELAQFPEDPRKELESMRVVAANAAAQIAELDREIAELKESVSAATEQDRMITTERAAIQTWYGHPRLLSERDQEIRKHTQAVEVAGVRFDVLAETVLSNEAGPETIAALRGLNMPELRESLGAYRDARDRHDLARARREAALPSSIHLHAAPWVFLLALSLILVGVGLVFKLPAVWGPAAAVAALGLALLLYARRARAGGDNLPTGQDAEDEVATAERRLRELVANVPIQETRLATGDLSLASDLQTLKMLLEEMRRETEVKESLVRQQVSDQRAIGELAARLGLETSSSAEATAADLVAKLEEAAVRVADADSASKRLSKCGQRRKQLAAEYAVLNRNLEVFVERLTAVGDGDVEKGCDVIRRRHKSSELAAATQHELEARFPDLTELVKEIENLNGAAALTDQELEAAEQRIESLDERIKELLSEGAALKERIATLLEQPVPADVESEIAVVEDRMRESQMARDRLMLLANVMAKADATFRERHQPDVLRRAAAMLRQVTAGAYTGLELDEDETGRLLVVPAGNGHGITVGPPLSRGTLDQIYLSLRLAIAEHLDNGGDPLPVFLDEVLVNWDKERRRAACGLLAEIAASRQLFFFTCHAWMAEELARHAGAHVVSI